MSLKKFLFETLVIIIGISISFWLNTQKVKWDNQKKEKALLESLKLNIHQIEKYLDNRQAILFDENHFMDYLSENWDDFNLDSVVNVLEKGRYIKSFHTFFLDYREFHPPVSEINSIINDGSIALISNTDIKLQLVSLMDNNYDFVNQNVQSEIELQQAFREKLLNEESDEIAEILKTSNEELGERFKGILGYREKNRFEIKVITKLKSAENYFNLKIRQRYWVMQFIEGFKHSLNRLEKLIDEELNNSK